MNKNEKFVITINRELGSGGRTVGRKLAERLGVAFYDKALIKALTEKYHLSVEEIEHMKGSSQSWWADFKRRMSIGQSADANYYIPKKGDEPELLTTDVLFETEQEILKGIAADESCVVAGRSGFYVFNKHPNHLSVLIQASMDFRLNRLVNKHNLTENEAVKAIEKVDKMRENYIKKYTGTSRYDTRNYDLVLRADGKTEDQLVDLILNFID
jgi:cytidylate kinase